MISTSVGSIGHSVHSAPAQQSVVLGTAPISRSRDLMYSLAHESRVCSATCSAVKISRSAMCRAHSFSSVQKPHVCSLTNCGVAEHLSHNAALHSRHSSKSGSNASQLAHFSITLTLFADNTVSLHFLTPFSVLRMSTLQRIDDGIVSPPHVVILRCVSIAFHNLFPDACHHAPSLPPMIRSVSAWYSFISRAVTRPFSTSSK